MFIKYWLIMFYGVYTTTTMHNWMQRPSYRITVTTTCSVEICLVQNCSRGYCSTWSYHMSKEEIHKPLSKLVCRGVVTIVFFKMVKWKFLSPHKIRCIIRINCLYEIVWNSTKLVKGQIISTTLHRHVEHKENFFI